MQHRYFSQSSSETIIDELWEDVEQQTVMPPYVPSIEAQPTPVKDPTEVSTERKRVEVLGDFRKIMLDKAFEDF